MSTYFYNPITKGVIAFGGLSAIASTGIYHFGLSSVASSFFFNSFISLLEIKMPECSGKPEQKGKDYRLIEEIKHEIINSNQNFENLKDTPMYISCLAGEGGAGASLYGEVHVGKKFINSNDYSVIKSVIAHEFGHLAENHLYIGVSNIVLSKLVGAVVFNFLMPTLKSSFLGGVLLDDVFAVEMLYKTINLGANAVTGYINKQLEYRADNAVVESGMGKDLMKFFITFRKAYPAQTEPSFLSSWSDDHPSIENRLLNIITQEKRLLDKEQSDPSYFQSLIKSGTQFLKEQCLESKYCSEHVEIKDMHFIDYATDYAYN